ncbi:hypothetical protein ACLOJK_020879 [Asimina triloba]
MVNVGDVVNRQIVVEISYLREDPYPGIPGTRVVDKAVGHARRRRGRQDRISSATQVGTQFVRGLHAALESSVETREAATMTESGSRGKRFLKFKSRPKRELVFFSYCQRRLCRPVLSEKRRPSQTLYRGPPRTVREKTKCGRGSTIQREAVESTRVRNGEDGGGGKGRKKRRKQRAQMLTQRPTRRRCEGTAMGAIVLDLHPGRGIGPFTLGMPICEAFAQVEQQPNIYDVVHVKYYDEEPMKLDIVISFPDHGFHLRFDPWSQRLRLIEVFDIKRLQMRYATSLIGGPSTLATFVAVYALFGPTFPGIYDKDRGVYTLFYPGLSFAFPIPTQYMDCCHDGEGISVAELPLEFPDGTTPVTCRVSVYDSSSDNKVGVGSLMTKALAPPLPAGSLYMEEVHAKLGDELWFTIGGQHIPFGASPQDVWTELGRPCGIHQKQHAHDSALYLHVPENIRDEGSNHGNIA